MSPNKDFRLPDSFLQPFVCEVCISNYTIFCWISSRISISWKIKLNSTMTWWTEQFSLFNHMKTVRKGCKTLLSCSTERFPVQFLWTCELVLLVFCASHIGFCLQWTINSMYKTNFFINLCDGIKQWNRK